ncbi:hypothetical protein BCR33DRAFT_497084 [Rhizoclosmatium globosum]|uniref:FZ domain-containing protein n=1 Tax=Rhizoclosmatium globosum TaxID=329046 RepID=A0A1Y2CUX6_9FUNG|nr:hypothetical protein BCR33DRAFT_497084 [Rhizoclosmatium globosum]|eukprot:ORY50859.1 hypothetical protein BCR33DRAFT_497084 [Rhizoclosmatium globosum]
MAMAASCVPYIHGASSYCSQFIDYPVYIPQNYSIQMIEMAMKAKGMDMLFSLNHTVLYQSCVTSFVKLSCLSAYPSCANGIADPHVACKSMCLDTVSLCRPLFTMLGRVASLPNCDGNVSTLPVPYSSNASCIGHDSQKVAEVNASCPATLRPNPNYNPNTTSISIEGQNCIGSCCLPCHFRTISTPKIKLMSTLHSVIS